MDACQKIVDLECDAFIVAGDLFHTGRPTSEALIRAHEGFKMVAGTGADCVLVAGNHEWIGVNRQRTSRSPAGLLDKFGVVQAPADPTPLRLDCGLWLGAAPWPTPGGDAEREWVDQVADLADDADSFDGPRLVVAHASIGEARFSTGSERELRALTREWTVPVSALDLDPFDAVRVGHIHRRQYLTDYVAYVGSPERFTFTDEGHQRGFSLLEWDDSEEVFTDTLIETARVNLQTITTDTELDMIPEGTLLRVELRDGEGGHSIDRQAIEDAGLRLIDFKMPKDERDRREKSEPSCDDLIEDFDPAELLEEWAVQNRRIGDDMIRLLEKGEAVHGWS